MTLKEKIKKFFRIIFGARHKQETYLTKLPEALEMEKYGKFIEQKVIKENADLRSENLALKAEKEDGDREEERKKEEEAIRQYILKQKEIQQQEEKQKTINFIISNIDKKKLPTFFLKSNVPFKNFAGIQFKELDDGSMVQYPILYGEWDKTKQKGFGVFKKATPNLLDFFKSDLGIVSQMRGGKIDTNFDINGDGKPVLLKKYVPEQENVRIIDMSDAEKRQYELEIDEYKKLVQKWINNSKELNNKVIKLESRLAESETITDSAEKERDIWSSRFGVYVQKTINMVKEVANALAEVQDLTVKQTLTERLNWLLADTVEEMRRNTAEKLPKGMNEIEKEKAFEDIDNAISMLKQVGKSESRLPLPSKG